MAEAVVEADDSQPAAAPVRRRGRPPGARDSKPRKRRADSLAGQVIAAAEAAAVPPSTPKPPRAPKAPAAAPMLPPPIAPAPVPRGEAQLNLSLNDLERKAKADADWKEAQARKLELELAVRAGSLMPREEVDTMLAERASLLQRSLLTLPDRISDELALENDGRRIRIRLRSELEAMIRTYSGQDDEDSAR